MKDNVAILPHTKGATQKHSYKVYLQIRIWQGNSFEPEYWGLVRDNSGHINPVQTTERPAPVRVLK